MSKIIIFGASGFVGQALTALLTKQNIPYAAPHSKTLNLTDPASSAAVGSLVEEGNSIIFLSAYTPEKGTADELTPKNISMIQHMLAGVKGKNLAQFIYVSSDAVYPMTADIIDEYTPPCPYDLYGQMHLLREQYVRAAIAPEKLTILRPCAIYGKADTHNSYSINRFIRGAMTQKEIALFGGGEEFRDHLYINDFAAIIREAYRKRITGLFNVASGKSWRFADIAALLQKQIGNVRVVQKPRAAAITHRHFNTAKLLATFPNHAPRQVPAGIAAFLEAMREP